MADFGSGGNRSGGKKGGGKGIDPNASTWANWQAQGLPVGGIFRKGNGRIQDASWVVPRIQRHLALHPEPAGGYGVQRKEGGGSEAAGGVKIPEGGGAKLPGGVQAKMQQKLGADLSDVNIHTGGESAKASEDLNARAFTKGADVYFGAGEFDPASKDGEKLLAHELTHVAQNKRGDGVQRKEESEGEEVESPEGEQLEVSDPDEPAEQEADAKSEEIASDDGKEEGEAAAEDGVQRRPMAAAGPQVSLASSTVALAPRGTQGPEMDQRNAAQGLRGMPEPPLPPGTLATQNGVEIKHYFPNDHGPCHFHVYGAGQNTKVGQNGNPIAGQPELSARQRQCVQGNAQVLERAGSQIMLWVRWATARGVYPASAANRAGD